MSTIEALPQLSGARPFIGHLPELGKDRLRFMQRLIDECDRIERVRSLGKLPLVAVNHPETLQQILVENARDYEKSTMLRFALYPLAGEGLFTSRGELWKRQRRLMAPLFQPGKIGAFGADMVACADRAIDAWRDGTELPLLRETTRIAMSVAGKTLFHADTFSEADEIGQALTTALEFVAANSPSYLTLAHLLLGRLVHAGGRFAPSLKETAERFERPIWVPGEEGRRLRAAVVFLDRTVQQMIDARRVSPGEHADLLTRLLEVRDEEDGATMSDKQIRDEILTLFVAGHETTATSMAWAIYELERNPSIRDAAIREADAIGHAPTVADLPRLPLTLRIFKEALRLYPPVYFDSRQAYVPTKIDEVTIPEGAVVLFAPYALHRRADLWPDPERFDPDRFTPEAEACRSRYAWLPFGAGPRVCIGMGFALMEGQLVLARLLQRAKFALLGDETPVAFATLRPQNGVRVRVKLRHQN